MAASTLLDEKPAAGLFIRVGNIPNLYGWYGSAEIKFRKFGCTSWKYLLWQRNQREISNISGVVE